MAAPKDNAKRNAGRLLESAVRGLADRKGSLVPVVSQLAQVARLLTLTSELRWLECELHGYGRGLARTMPVGEALGLPDGSSLLVTVNEYRLLRKPVVFDLGADKVREVHYPLFVPDKVSDVEHRLDRLHSGDAAIVTVASWAMQPQFAELMRIFRRESLEFNITALDYSRVLQGLRDALAELASSVQLKLMDEDTEGSPHTVNQVVSGTITASVVNIITSVREFGQPPETPFTQPGNEPTAAFSNDPRLVTYSLGS